MASTPGPAFEFLGRVAYELTTMRPLMPTYLHLLVSAIFPIYTAAHASLARPSSAAKPEKKSKSSDSDDDVEDGETVNKIEGLSPSDALIFPLMAGLTLASLYFLLKWLQDPAWLNWALGIYFSWIGLFLATKFIKDVLSVVRSLFLPTQYSAHGKVWANNGRRDVFKSYRIEENSALPGFFRYLPLPNFFSKAVWKFRRAVYAKASLHFHIHKVLRIKCSVDSLDLISCAISIAIVYYHTFVAKPWFLTNFLGFAFCYGALQLMTPTTAWTGTLLLSALFFYDIYFVFYTPMMVTVATKLDVPIKLLFPRPNACVLPIEAADGSELMEEYLQCLAKKRTMAMLGLGDIVIPGMILAFALRFDLYLYYLRKKTPAANGDFGEPSKQEIKPKYLPATGNWGERLWTSKAVQSPELRAKYFPKTYFNVTVFGYLIGMITTVVVMQVFEHAQPALLYLVPGVLISLWGTALVKGDFKLLWQYTEDSEEDEEKEKQNNKKKNKAKSKQSGDAPSEEVAEDNGKVQKSQDKDANDESTENKDSKQSALTLSEKNCSHIFLLSITFPETKKPTRVLPPANSRKSSATIEGNIQDAVANVIPRRSFTGTSAEPTPSNSTRSRRSTLTPADSTEDEDLPDVRADKAVMAKLTKEINASCADTVDTRGGEPPEKRRRKA